MNNLKKILSVTDIQDKKFFLFVLILMFIGMLFETFGIAMVVPILEFILSTDGSKNESTLSLFINENINISSLSINNTLIISLISFFTIKTFFLTFLSWKQIKLHTNLLEKISVLMYKKYFALPYKYFLNSNSSSHIRNIYTEVGVFTNGVIANLLVIISETIILLGIVLLLIYYQPMATIIIISLFILIITIYRYLSRIYVRKWANQRQISDGLKLKNLNQGFGAFKEIKVLGRQNYFINNFNIHNSIYANIYLKISFLISLPRFWLEWISILLLCIILLTLSSGGISTVETIPTLGLFAAAAFRLIPSISRIIAGYQGLNFAMPGVERIYEIFSLDNHEINLKTVEKIKFKDEIILKDINFNYPNTSRPSLTNVNLNIKQGEAIGIVGESGSGKSTLISILLSIISPHSGKVTVDGINIQKNIRDWQDKIGYVPQNIYITDESILNNIAFGIKDEDIDLVKVERAIKLANLEEFIYNLPNKLKTPAGEMGTKMSGGQLQRIGIARALYHEPEVLILDECSSSLDYETEKEIMNEIYNLCGKKTIIIITHRLNTISKCDSVIRMHKGTVDFRGSYKDLKKV
tara:strand:- start:12147 stop:13892 length:1746 start_codon:yes stop_codon:yes gene_type:complete